MPVAGIQWVVRISQVPVAWSELPGSAVPARYRADFFAEVTQPMGTWEEPGMWEVRRHSQTWWLVEQAYSAADADLAQLLVWADFHAGTEGRYALYLECKLAGDDVMVELLAGEDPTSPDA
jgi:hypothetical protein